MLNIANNRKRLFEDLDDINPDLDDSYNSDHDDSVDAVGDAKKAARAVGNYLNGQNWGDLGVPGRGEYEPHPISDLRPNWGKDVIRGLQNMPNPNFDPNAGPDLDEAPLRIRDNAGDDWIPRAGKFGMEQIKAGLERSGNAGVDSMADDHDGIRPGGLVDAELKSRFPRAAEDASRLWNNFQNWWSKQPTPPEPDMDEHNPTLRDMFGDEKVDAAEAKMKEALKTASDRAADHPDYFESERGTSMTPLTTHADPNWLKKTGAFLGDQIKTGIQRSGEDFPDAIDSEKGTLVTPVRDHVDPEWGKNLASKMSGLFSKTAPAPSTPAIPSSPAPASPEGSWYDPYRKRCYRSTPWWRFLRKR